MSLSTLGVFKQYQGNSVTTVFSFPYRFLENTNLKVTLNGVEQTLGNHYTVTGAGNDNGGSVVMNTAPASGQTLLIERVMPLTQEVSYSTGDSFPAETHEEALDRLTMITQQLNDGVNRSIRFPVGESVSELPPAQDRNGKFLGFGSSGQPVMLNPTLQTISADTFVDNIDSLRLLTGVFPDQAVQPLGYYAPGDGGGGPVRVWKSGAAPGTYVDNGGSIIVPTGGDGSGAWVWEHSGAVNVKWFGAKGDGVADDSHIIQGVLDFVLSLASGSFNSGVPSVEFPSGEYIINNTVIIRRINLTESGAGMLHLRGDSSGAATFRTTVPGTVLWQHFGTGTIFENFRGVGHTSFDTTFMKIGNETGIYPNDLESVGNQLLFKNIRLTLFNKGFVIGRCYDSRFSDVRIIQIAGTNCTAVEILSDINDKSNNILFERCHFEEFHTSASGDCSIVRSRGSSGRESYAIQFLSCHFETVQYLGQCLDIQYARDWSFNTCVIASNDRDGRDPVTAPYNITIGNTSSNIQFINCPITRVTGNINAKKLINFIGAVFHINFKSCFFGGGGITRIENCYDNNSDNVTFAGLNLVKFHECQVGSYGDLPQTNHIDLASNLSNSNNIRLRNFRNPTASISDLFVQIASTARPKDTDWQQRAVLYGQGISTLGMLGPCASIAVDNNTSVVLFQPPNITGPSGQRNPNRTGVYLLASASGSDLIYAMFICGGTSCTPLITGTNVAIGNTDPNTPDKLNIFRDSSGAGAIGIHNRFGSQRILMLWGLGVI